MKTHLVWDNCSLFKKPIMAFWVSCSPEEAENIIFPLLSKKNKAIFNKTKYENLNYNTRWALVNPQLAEPEKLYFLVSRDLREIIIEQVVFPYSSQWNAYCPFIEIDAIEVNNINDLKDIKVRILNAE